MDETLRLTAHCVGVTGQGLLFQQHCKGPVRWLCVQWSDLAAGLCSPFYEHELELRAVSDGIYSLEQWHSMQLRLTDTPHTFGKRARELLRQTFFPLLARPTSTAMEGLDKERHLPWELRNKPLATRYNETSGFSLDAVLQFQGTAKEFWHQHLEQHRATLKGLFDNLELNVVQNPQALWRALELWGARQAHQTPYLRHRLLEMDALFTVCCHNDWLQVPIASLSPASIQDLARLHSHLRALARNPTTTPRHYNNLPNLLRYTLRDKLPLMLRHYLQGVVCSERRRQLLDQLLVPALMEHCEAQALQDHSTCFPVTLKSLHWHYSTLMGLPSGDDDLRAMLPFEIDYCGVESAHCATFEPTHLREVVLHMIRVSRLSQRPLRWQHLEAGPLQKPYAPVFVIHTKSEELSRERYLRRVWEDCQCHRQLLVSPYAAQWDVEAWRSEYETLEDIERQLYSARFVLLQFTPVEMRRADDLAIVGRLLRSDFFATSLIRPARAEWTQGRLLRHFADSLSPDDLAAQLHFVGDARALRDTLVVLDAHLYSNREMQALLDWLSSERGNYAHCVMLGAADTHPLHCDGHAFLDLAQWVEPALIRTRSFDTKQHATDFLALLQCAAPIPVRATRLQELLESAIGTNTAMLLHLAVQTESDDKRAISAYKELQAQLEEHLSTKFRHSCHLTMRLLPLDSLHALGTMPQVCQLVVTTRAFVQTLKRNELNHLLMTVPGTLLILTPAEESGAKQPLGWLAKQVERQTFPNMRHTLPFLVQQEQRVSTSGDRNESL